DPFEGVAVAPCGGVVVGAEGDRRLRRTHTSFLDKRACDGGEVDWRPGRACLEAGESEQVADEAAESFAVAGDGCFEAVALGPFRLFAEEGFDACLEGRDGGPELVGGVGEKAARRGVAG